MNNRTEQRLRRALAARAEQVTPESLRPLPAPEPRSDATARWARPLLAAAAVTAVVGGLTYAGLTGEQTRVGPATKPGDRVVTGTSCPRESDLVARALNRNWLDADVDGDNRPDRVAVARDAAGGEAACRVFVGVRTATGVTYSNALTPSAVADANIPFPPTVVGLPELGDPGAEIAVDGHARADGALVQLFTLVDGRLALVEVPGSDDDAFYLEGAGVTMPHGAACRADGTLVLSTAEARGRDYRVTRRHYELVGERLEAVSAETTEAVAGDALVRRFPEFGPSHFSACSGQVKSSGL